MSPRWSAPHAINNAPANHWEHQCQWRKCPKEGQQQTAIALPFCADHLRVITTATAKVRAIEVVIAEQRQADRVTRQVDLVSIVEKSTEPSQPKLGWLYFVRVDDLIKIGYTTNLYQRLRHYPPNAVVLATQPGTMKMEKALHGQFRFALAKGREWFHVRPEIVEHIAGVVAAYGEPSADLQDRYRDANRPHNVTARKGWSGGRAA